MRGDGAAQPIRAGEHARLAMSEAQTWIVDQENTLARRYRPADVGLAYRLDDPFRLFLRPIACLASKMIVAHSGRNFHKRMPK